MRAARQSQSIFALVTIGALMTIFATPTLSEEATNASNSAIALRYSAGFDYSEGDYGLRDTDRLAEDTKLYYIPLGATLDVARFRGKIVIPFLISDGPTRITSTGEAGQSRVEAGLGQIGVSGSYLFDPFHEGLPFLETALKITAPSETNRDLGTGLWAFAVQMDLFQRYGWFTPFASGGRKFYTGRSLDDRFYTSVGASIEVASGMSVGLSYDWLEATTSAAEDAHELVPFISFRPNAKWTVGPYAVVGLSDGSPNFGLGFSVSVRP